MVTDGFQERSQRIEILRTVCILGVVLLHVPPITDVPLGQPYAWEWLVNVKFAIRHAIFRASVPTLSVISGYLLFGHFTPDRYLATVRKRFRTLIIPLVLWNLPWVLLWLLMQNDGVSHDGAPFGLGQVWEVIDLTVGIAGRPLNVPTHFLLDLFVCFLCAPIFHALVRRAPYLGLVLLLALMFSGQEAYTHIRGDILFSFYLGALVATKRWTLAVIDRYWWAFFVGFLALCVAFTAVEAARDFPRGAFYHNALNGLRLAGPFAFWGLSAFLVRTAAAGILIRWGAYAFFIFCAHAPILKVLWWGWRATIGDQTEPSYWLFYVVAPVVTTATAVGLLRLLERIAPPLLTVLAVRNAPGRSTSLGHHCARCHCPTPASPHPANRP